MIARFRAAWRAFTAPDELLLEPSPLHFAFGGTVWPGLAKLAEESCEVGQVLAKLIQTGGDPQHWSGDMVAKLVEELPDQMAASAMFIELNPILHPFADRMRERYEAKRAQFREWHYDTLAARITVPRQ